MGGAISGFQYYVMRESIGRGRIGGRNGGRKEGRNRNLTNG